MKVFDEFVHVMLPSDAVNILRGLMGGARLKIPATICEFALKL